MRFGTANGQSLAASALCASDARAVILSTSSGVPQNCTLQSPPNMFHPPIRRTLIKTVFRDQIRFPAGDSHPQPP